MKTCINCGKQIQRRFAYKYCSDACKNEHYRQSGYFSAHGKKWRAQNKMIWRDVQSGIEVKAYSKQGAIQRLKQKLNLQELGILKIVRVINN